MNNWGEAFKNIHRVPVCEGCSSYYVHATHSNYLEGFIHRRVEIDNIPLSEIYNYLLVVEERISKIDKTNLDSYLFKINKNIYLTFSNDNLKLHNANKYIILDTRAQRITLNKDSTGDYFLIWNYENGSYRALYNQNLELIN